MIGVLAGLLLVNQVQDFRNKAKESANKTFTICHKNTFGEIVWEELEVSQGDLKVYLDQGDILGECPPTN